MAIRLTSIRRLRRAALAALTALALPATGLRAQPADVTPPIAGSASMPTAAAGADLALQALMFVGVPYRFGGEDPARGFDCSGLVRHVARTVLGVELPRSSEAIASVGQPVPRQALQGGDLVFFNTRGHRNSHVGVYIGDGRFVHAPARNGLVRIEAIADRYWRARFSGGRRLLRDAESVPASPPPAEDAASGAAPSATDPRPVDGRARSDLDGGA